LFIVDYLKFEWEANLDGFYLRQNKSEQIKKFNEPLKTATGKGLRRFFADCKLAFTLGDPLKPLSVRHFIASV
jgi:hypothetical protein